MSVKGGDKLKAYIRKLKEAPEVKGVEEAVGALLAKKRHGG